MKVLTALTILYINSSISSYTSNLIIGYYTKENKTNKSKQNKKITISLSFPPFANKSHISYKNCASESFIANQGSFNKEMNFQFRAEIKIKCIFKNNRKQNSSVFYNIGNTIKWDSDILEKIILGKKFDLSKSSMSIKGNEIGVGAITGIEAEDFIKWENVVKNHLENKGLYSYLDNSNVDSDESASDEYIDTDYWPVFEGTFSTVIPENLLI